MIPFSYYSDKFLNYVVIEKNYSNHTFINYRIDLKEFGDFLGSQKALDIKEIDYCKSYTFDKFMKETTKVK